MVQVMDTGRAGWGRFCITHIFTPKKTHNILDRLNFFEKLSFRVQ